MIVTEKKRADVFSARTLLGVTAPLLPTGWSTATAGGHLSVTSTSTAAPLSSPNAVEVTGSGGASTSVGCRSAPRPCSSFEINLNKALWPELGSMAVCFTSASTVPRDHAEKIKVDLNPFSILQIWTSAAEMSRLTTDKQPKVFDKQTVGEHPFGRRERLTRKTHHFVTG